MKRVLQLLLGFALLGGMVVGVVYVAIATARWFSDLDSDSATALSGLSGLLAVAIITFLSNRWLERRRSTEQATREKRVELYEKLVSFWMSVFSPEQLGRRPTEVEVLEFLTDLTPQLIAFGSNDVIKAWGQMRMSALADTQPPETRLKEFEDFFKAIRKDLGHSTRGLDDGDIVRLWINDYDQLVTKTRVKR